MAGDEENPVPPPKGEGESAPAVEGATKMFSMKLDAWLSDFSPGDLLGEQAPSEGAAAPEGGALVEPLDIAPIAPAPAAVVAPAPRVVVPGLIPPPDAVPAGRGSSADLLAPAPGRISHPDLSLAAPGRISQPDLSLSTSARISHPDLSLSTNAPTIDPLAPPIVVSPAPPPGVSAAAVLIGLPREQPEAPRSKATLIILLVILVLAVGLAAAFFLYGDQLPFLKAA